MPARADQPPPLAAKRRPRVWPMAARPRPLSSLPAREGSLQAQLKAGRRVAATQGKISDSGARSSGLREHGRLSGRWSVAQKPSGTRSPRWGWEQRVLMHSEGRGRESSACRIQHPGLWGWVARASARAGGELGPEGDGLRLLSSSSRPQAQGDPRARPNPGAPVSAAAHLGVATAALPGSWLLSAMTPTQNSPLALGGPDPGPGILDSEPRPFRDGGALRASGALLAATVRNTPEHSAHNLL